MKHINLSKTWEYSTEPFPAFRANLVFGRNKRDRAFVPVKDVSPQYTVFDNQGVVAYTGPNKEEARRLLTELRGSYYSIQEPVLIDNTFKVIITKEKGTIMIVPGNDTTNRCLLFIDVNGGFRGGCSLEKETTGQVLKTCHASNNCESSLAVAALLDVDQTIVFHSYGRHGNNVFVHTWNGEKIISTKYSKAEWLSKNENASSIEEAEEL